MMSTRKVIININILGDDNLNMKLTTKLTG